MDPRERHADLQEVIRAALDARAAQAWTALPGTVVSFDPTKQTATVQPAVMPNLRNSAGATAPIAIAVIPDCPVIFPRAGGFALTFPLLPGDEGLMVVSSRCIDGWHQSGGDVVQSELRYQDLSDSFFIPGASSAPRALALFDPLAAELRSADGLQRVSLLPGGAMQLVTPGALQMAAPAGGTFNGLPLVTNPAPSLTMLPLAVPPLLPALNQLVGSSGATFDPGALGRPGPNFWNGTFWVPLDPNGLWAQVAGLSDPQGWRPSNNPRGVPGVRMVNGVKRYTTECVFYVENGGSIHNHGLSPSDPWPDAQWAYMQIQEHWRCNGSFPVIELAPGTYHGVPAGTYNRYNDAFGVGAPFLQMTGLIGGAQFTGGSPLFVRGRGPDLTDWGSVVIDVIKDGALDPTGAAISIIQGATLILGGLTIGTHGGCPYIINVNQSAILELGNINLGDCLAACVNLDSFGQSVSTGNFNVLGTSMPSVFRCNHAELIHGVGVGIADGPNYTAGFVNVDSLGFADLRGSYGAKLGTIADPPVVSGLKAVLDWGSVCRGAAALANLPGTGITVAHGAQHD